MASDYKSQLQRKRFRSRLVFVEREVGGPVRKHRIRPAQRRRRRASPMHHQPTIFLPYRILRNPETHRPCGYLVWDWLRQRWLVPFS